MVKFFFNDVLIDNFDFFFRGGFSRSADSQDIILRKRRIQLISFFACWKKIHNEVLSIDHSCFHWSLVNEGFNFLEGLKVRCICRSEEDQRIGIIFQRLCDSTLRIDYKSGAFEFHGPLHLHDFSVHTTFAFRFHQNKSRPEEVLAVFLFFLFLFYFYLLWHWWFHIFLECAFYIQIIRELLLLLKLAIPAWARRLNNRHEGSMNFWIERVFSFIFKFEIIFFHKFLRI